MNKLITIITILLSLPILCFSQQSLKLCDEDSLNVFTYTSNTGVPGTYFWSIDNGPQVIDGPSYSVVWGLYGEGWHTLTVSFEDAAGCNAEPVSLSVNVEICAKTTMWAPNCFTPDGDENNNIWVPIGTNYHEPYYFIVNRWGQIIFESYNLNVGWDGTYGGKECQDGVYVYCLRWKDYDNRSKEMVGHITLLR